ncbi:hypothetical protein D1AOALGA4SA_3208 [Olavius algarvensis Delta 1 endosymbiont]|nr:hypothetical protein D1AOALGA4SA_3208 [Olavius algarvensis Delta 1 endosymbiont]
MRNSQRGIIDQRIRYRNSAEVVKLFFIFFHQLGNKDRGAKCSASLAKVLA